MAGQEMQTIEMARGTRYLVPVVPGTLVLVRRGTIQLRLPSVWPESVFSPITWRLDTEERFTAAAPGYAEFTAVIDSEVLIAAPETMSARMHAAAGALCETIRRHWTARRALRASR